MLDQLPPEILHTILSYLTPRATDDACYNQWHYSEMLVCEKALARISQASRSLQRVAEPLLYRHLQFPSLALLGTLCRRPELGEHVRYISEGGNSQPSDVESCVAVVDLLHKHLRPVVRDRYWPALDRFLEHLLDNGIDFDHTRYNEPRVDPGTVLLALTLCLTPRVEVLHVSVEVLDEGHYEDPLARLFRLCGRYALGAMRQNRKSGTPIPVAPLFHLREMCLNGDTCQSEPASICRPNIHPLLLHPRLEKLELSRLSWSDTSRIVTQEEEYDAEEEYDDDDDPNDEKWPFRELFTSPGSHYRLKQLKMSGGSPHTVANLRETLTIFPSIETLDFVFIMSEDRVDINLTLYGTALRELGRNLRRFRLEPCWGNNNLAEDWDKGAIGPLRHYMGNLEQLSVPLASLIGTEPEVGGDDLCAYLPESLRWFATSVTVGGDLQADYRALARMLWESGLQGGGRLPVLDWIMVRLPSDDPTGPTYVPPAFDVARLNARHVLYTRRSAAPVTTPQGWANAFDWS